MRKSENYSARSTEDKSQNQENTMQTVTVLDANAFPPELLETSQPVVGFIGLDCNRNLTHKSIWDAFNSNRKSDR